MSVLKYGHQKTILHLAVLLCFLNKHMRWGKRGKENQKKAELYCTLTIPLKEEFIDLRLQLGYIYNSVSNMTD